MAAAAFEFLLLFNVFSPVVAQTPDGWIISGDEILVHQSRTVRGDLVLTPGSTLRILGSELLVEGRVFVDAYALLELAPFEGKKSRLGAADAAAVFWVLVNGTMRSYGTPRSLIDGLEGDGLSLFAGTPGGLQVNGVAEFDDLEVRNSTAGIMAGEHAKMRIRRSTLESLGFSGLQSRGSVTVEDTNIIDNEIGVFGRLSCSITFRNTTIRSGAANVQLNNCGAKLSSSLLDGGQRSVFLNGGRIQLIDSIVQAYGRDGLSSSGAARFELTNVSLIGGAGARNAMNLRTRSNVTLDYVTIQDHEGDGISLSDSSLFLKSSRIISNGGYGVRAMAGSLRNDLGVGNDFGSKESGTTNGLGPVSQVAYHSISLLDDTGRPLTGFSVDIQRKDTGQPVFRLENSAETSIQVGYETYEMDSAGNPRPIGLFTYTVVHALVPKGVRGVIDEADRHIDVSVSPSSGMSSSRNWLPMIFTAALAFAGAAFITYGVGGHRLKRLLNLGRKR